LQPLIITVALVGAEVTRQDHPKLPITPEEIAEAAIECWKAGASICHLHVREADGKPTQNKELFRETIRQIQKSSDMIIQVSTGGAVGMTEEERLQPVSLAPEMATLTVGTVNFGDDVFYNSPKLIERFAKEMLTYGVKPELEIFDTGMIANAIRLWKKGLLQEPLHFDFVMGVPGGIPATFQNLLHLVDALPPNATWSVAGIGRHQLPLATLAIMMGGHVRVGFEDNIYYSKGVLADSNAQLVERIVRIAKELDRPIATPEEARKILGIARQTQET
jgi:3-keto-5-aminohexanoate cleavage enzyme